MDKIRIVLKKSSSESEVYLNDILLTNVKGVNAGCEVNERPYCMLYLQPDDIIIEGDLKVISD